MVMLSGKSLFNLVCPFELRPLRPCAWPVQGEAAVESLVAEHPQEQAGYHLPVMLQQKGKAVVEVEVEAEARAVVKWLALH